MNFEFSNDEPARVIVMVSRMGHCLNDLIFRWRAGSLGGDIVAVVSNHIDLRRMAEAADLPFFHIPVTPATKSQAEEELLQLVERYDADLVVLARYMQVLSDDSCRAFTAVRSTSTTLFCPVSREPSPTTRRLIAVSNSSAPPPTTSRPTSTKDRSSSKRSSASTTRTIRRDWRPSAATPRRWRSRGRFAGIVNGAFCCMATAPSSCADARRPTEDLSILCGRQIDTCHPGCRVHVLPGGRLRIVDPTRGVVVTYPSATTMSLRSPGQPGRR